MKTQILDLKTIILLVILTATVFSCNKDNEQEPDHTQVINNLFAGVESTVLKTVVNENTSGPTENKSVPVAIGEAVARSKKLFCERYAGVTKYANLSNEQELQMIQDVLPQFTDLLTNAYTEIYRIKVKQGEAPGSQSFKDSMGNNIREIITGVKDITPKRYVSLIQKPRIREEYAMLYASVRLRLGYTEIGDCYLEMIEHLTLYDYSGPFTVFYYDSNPDLGNDTEILIPVTKSFDDINFEFNGKMEKITARVVEQSSYASYLYKGNTSTLHVAWLDFYDWSLVNGLNIDFPAREIYWYEDHDILENIVTELQFVLK